MNRTAAKWPEKGILAEWPSSPGWCWEKAAQFNALARAAENIATSRPRLPKEEGLTLVALPERQFQHWADQASPFALVPPGLRAPQRASAEPLFQSCCNTTETAGSGLLPVPGHPVLHLQTPWLPFHRVLPSQLLLSPL